MRETPDFKYYARRGGLGQEQDFVPSNRTRATRVEVTLDPTRDITTFFVDTDSNRAIIQMGAAGDMVAVSKLFAEGEGLNAAVHKMSALYRRAGEMLHSPVGVFRGDDAAMERARDCFALAEDMQKAEGRLRNGASAEVVFKDFLSNAMLKSEALQRSGRNQPAIYPCPLRRGH